MLNKQFRDLSRRLLKIGNRAVRKAQAENRRLGLPNVYARNGKIWFELPDGTRTTTNPLTHHQSH